MANMDEKDIFKNLNVLTGVQLLNFIYKHNMPYPPNAPNTSVRPLFGKAKKNKKKNATQKPAFITRPFQKQQQPGSRPQPRGPITHQPRPPAPQNFQAPHHQQETMVDLTDDTAPETPLPAGGWKPLSAPGEAPSGSNMGTKKTSNTFGKQMKMQGNLKKKKGAQQANANKFSTMKPVNQKDFNELATTRQQQGEKEIKWEVNLVDDSDDEKPSASTVHQGQQAPTKNQSNVQHPPTQTRVQGFPPEIKPVADEKQKPHVPAQTPTSKSEETSKPGTSYSNEPGRILRNVNTLEPQLPVKPQKIYVEKRNPPPLPPALPRKAMAGIPRSFLTAQHMAGICGAIQPLPSSSVQEGPSWAPNHVLHEPQQFNPVPVQTSCDAPTDVRQQYSPSDVYDDLAMLEQDPEDGSESSSQSAQKRLSAFQRLGPVARSKKPKLTINILYNKDQAVREVVDETQPEEKKYVPVHLRPDILESRDETVDRYLSMWPWKRTVSILKSVTHRTSKSVMILEQEQMEEAYEKEHAFFQVSVRGYPPHWRKEDVLDVMLESVRGKSFIPCFVEFTAQECKFLVIRCRSALTAIHKLGFYVRKDDLELCATISQTDLSLNQIDFMPRLVLRKRLAMEYDGERKLSLKEFTVKPDVSHFIYFPLNRLTNQTELTQLQSTVAWDYLTDLDLSHNRLTSLDGFDLPKTTPKLKHLDVSHNWLERVTTLVRCRELALRSLRLEGNPLCRDYTDPGRYVKVLRMIFPCLVEIDDMPIRHKGDLPDFKRNYCPEDAQHVAERFLEVFFPLLDLPAEDRLMIEDLYDEKAVLTVTYRYNLRYSPLHRYFRNLFLRARAFEDGETDAVEGAAAIAKLVAKWPALEHDPYAITADVMHHSESHTILRISGILKLTSDSLAEDEHLLSFTRTLVLATRNGTEYKIQNEMLYWDDATGACAYGAFQINSVRLKKLSLKFESTPDKDLQEQLATVFMKLTELNKSASLRCLEMKEWNLKSALEHFIKLLKLNDLDSLKI